MTAHQKAVEIFRKNGDMEPLPFGAQMFPTLYRAWDSTTFSTEVGKFLAGMVRLGMVRKVGRRYGAKRIRRE